MNQLQSNPDVLARLKSVANKPRLPASLGRAAAKLVQSLSGPPRIVIFGPVDEANSMLAEELSNRLDMAEIDLSVRSSDQGFDAIDMAIWCSFVFGRDEQLAWSDAPESLRDRSLVVIMTDRQGPVALPFDPSTMFERLYHLPVNDALPTLDNISRHISDRIQTARAADLDQALYLLSQFPAREEEPRDKSFLHAAEKLLRDHAHGALEIEEPDDAAYAQAVLASCAQVGEVLNDHFEQADGVELPQGLQENVAQAHDDIILMSLEGDVAAAGDAIARLMQVRAQLQNQLAA